MVYSITKTIYSTTLQEKGEVEAYLAENPDEQVVTRNIGASDMKNTYSEVEITFGRFIDENPKAPGQYWEEWVGSQTPTEFISYNEPNQTTEEAVSDYVESTAKDFAGERSYTEDELDEVKSKLSKYIESYMQE